MFDPMFVPPVENPGMRRLAGFLLPTLAHALYRIENVRLPDEDKARLEGLGPGRAIVSPNHPSWHDTVVMLWISRILRQPFNSLAAREILDGWTGRILNQLGAYSVIRGTADRESLRTTRRLLAELDRKVVIFPEGEI